MIAYTRPHRHVGKRFPLLFSAILCILAGLSAPAQPIPSGHIRVHYHRPDANYAGWTMYAFFDTTEFAGDYSSGLVPPTNSDAYGVYFDVAVVANAQNLGLIIHNPSAPGGDQKDPGPNEFVDPSKEGFEYWG